ncbi:MAG: winged helix-turn-helix domain-containing protein [Bacilli bacterium]|nr:winged helix-turn-helix domain-containing protein [Bacilli bacterium]
MPEIEIQRLDGSIVKCDVEKRTLSYYRYHVKFTPLEWKILKELYARRPNVVARADLIKLIWGDKSISPTRTIDVHISSIRKKLAYIKGARVDSVYGTGYRLVMLSRF